MLKKFALWFICFGLSFLVERIGWTEQGKAFLYIDLGMDFLIISVFLVIIIIGALLSGHFLVASGISIVTVITIGGILAITLFATWGATELFDVDFYVAYQIITFGQCLCPQNKKKEDD